MEPKEFDDQIENNAETIGEEKTPEAEQAESGSTPPVMFQKTKDRLSKLYPDRTFESDDDYDALMDEHMGRIDESNNALTQIFDSNPEIVDILKDLREGATLRVAIASKYSPEELVSQEGDMDYEAWSERSKMREKSMQENEAREAEVEANLTKSGENIKAFADQEGLDEAGMNDFIASIQGVFDDYNNGILSTETLAMLYNGKNHESKMASAKEQYLAEGRNEQIAARKMNTVKSDGIPSIQAGGGEITKEVKKTPQQMGEDYINRLKK